VPTPFQHLNYAERVYRHPGIPPQVRRLLDDAWGPYLLGNTAGDVQVMTAQPRVETHFYRLADIGVRSAVDTLLAAHPDLADPGSLSPARAAFLTGYLVHLVWDEVWARDIFIPLYQNASHWNERRAYFLHHNALRLFLDRKAYAALQGCAPLVAALRGTVPCRFLPFATDRALIAWRDWLVEQLTDPATVQTSAVFAQRMQMPVEELEEVVRELQSGRYAKVPEWASAVERFEARALEESVETVLSYWGIRDRLNRVTQLRQPHVGG
jgi:hypothetical protein